MEKRCYGCMELYESVDGVCPYCGHKEGEQQDNATHLIPGTLLSHRFIVGRVVGYGGFGVTYLGWDMLLAQKVAIKEYLPSEFSTRVPGTTMVTIFEGEKKEQFTAGREKFVDEARRLAQFTDQSGIVKVIDSFKENDTAYIVMEYIDGVTLEEYLKEHGKIDTDDAVLMLLPIIEALKEVHKAGIVHRDIAPNNIMVAKNGAVKLIDFGAARYATATHTKSLTVIVKPGYSPEEQYMSRGDQGAHTDVYAIGATLYRMITGVVPPDALDRRTEFQARGKDILVPPSKYNKRVPKNCRNAILNALSVEIAKRTPDLETLEYELTTDDPVRRNDDRIKITDVGRWPMWLKITVPLAAVCVIVLSVLFANGIIGFHANLQDEMYTPEGMVRVPYICNMPEESAIAKLEDNELSIMIKGREISKEIPKGMVYSQDIAANTPVEVNTQVSVLISGGPELKTVGSLKGDEAKKAREELEAQGFIVEEKEEYNNTVPAGNIIAVSSQDGTVIEAGTELEAGTKIVLTVSKGADPQTQIEEKEIEVDNYIGLTYETALELAAEKGIVLNVFEKRYSDQYQENIVMEQSVEAGTKTSNNITIDIVVSLGVKTVKVPEVVYETEERAIELLLAAEFDRDSITITYVEHENVEKGIVISQTPEGGTITAPGTQIELVISLGKSYIDVPNMEGKTEAEAKSSLGDLKLKVNVLYANSDTVESGKVISQDIKGEKAAKRNDTITITVSSGEQLYEMPNVVGADQTAAEQSLKAAGFSVRTEAAYNDNGISAGTVISQNRTAGESFKKGTEVLLIVSLGETPYTVPNVVGSSEQNAVSKLVASGFNVSVAYEYNKSVGKGIVIGQSYAEGTNLKKNTTITITVSSGVKLVSVPNVMGSDSSSAQSAINNAGFKVASSEAYSDTVPSGTVISQSPEAGSSQEEGITVSIVVSKGTDKVAVPGVTGKSEAQATTELNNAGFGVTTESQYSDNFGKGQVISQSVAGGTMLKPGTSSIHLVVSLGTDKVSVAGVEGKSEAEARSILSGQGFGVTTQSQYHDSVPAGSVISQSAAAGTMLKPGAESIQLVISLGQEMVMVVDVSGKDKASAEAELTALGISVTYGADEYSQVPEGCVIRQSVAGGTSIVKKGAQVTLIISKGKEPYTITYNANGGSVGVGSQTKYVGDALGDIPTPTRDYHTFAGWTDDAGNAVNSGTVYNSGGNRNLTAQWQLNGESSWVLENQVPAGAQVLNTKYSYTKTTVSTTWSTAAALDGYARTGNAKWKQTGSGSQDWGSFPNGYQDSFGLSNGQPYQPAENETNKRDVVNNWSGYVYWHWMYDCGGGNAYNRRVYTQSGRGPSPDYWNYKYFGSFQSGNDYATHEENTYGCGTVWKVTDRSSYADTQGSWWWFRFDYYTCTYTDYIKEFEYIRTTVENLESAAAPSGSDISNVQKWITYRPK